MLSLARGPLRSLGLNRLAERSVLVKHKRELDRAAAIPWTASESLRKRHHVAGLPPEQSTESQHGVPEAIDGVALIETNSVLFTRHLRPPSH